MPARHNGLVNIQLLSDLHLEVQPDLTFQPAPGADLLVLAGDIGSYQYGSRLAGPDFGLDRFSPLRGWPVPVLVVAGNHEFDARDFDDALRIVERIYAYQGAGHSVGLHGSTAERALMLGERLPVSRVIVDQAHCIATGGSFDNGLPFSLSMQRILPPPSSLARSLRTASPVKVLPDPLGPTSAMRSQLCERTAFLICNAMCLTP